MAKQVCASWFVAVLAMAAMVPASRAADEVELPPAVGNDAPEAESPKTDEVWAPAVEPKPLSENVKAGLKWLADHQLDCGGWGQGEESAVMRGSSQIRVMNLAPRTAEQTQQAAPLVPRSALPASGPEGAERQAPDAAPPRNAAPKSEIASVADTCMATLALIRSGSTPSKGPYRKSIVEAVRFVCGQIEESDPESIFVTSVQGTRVQSKLGPYIDTFLAAMLLPEVAGKMPSKKENRRVDAALKRVLAKMEKNQRPDGTWSDSGWAATLAQGAAVKGLNRAAQIGYDLAEQTRERAEKKAQAAFDSTSGRFSAAGSAGVELYSSSSNVSQLAESVNTNAGLEAEAKRKLDEAKDDQERADARQQLERFAQAKRDLEAQKEAIVSRLDDASFIAGFGNNGGEEFLSYMNIGESLVVEGGDEWKSWDKSITENLNRVQNSDGSWTGHHCITGRTFCTSAALLVLMVDRAPMPVSGRIGRR